MKLRAMPGMFAVSRLAPDADFPSWAMSGIFRTLSWTRDELSVVCEESLVASDVRSERGWRALMVEGPLDFGLTGILVQIARPLADAGISIFAISTFDTDYVLVKDHAFSRAQTALAAHGHTIEF